MPQDIQALIEEGYRLSRVRGGTRVWFYADENGIVRIGLDPTQWAGNSMVLFSIKAPRDPADEAAVSDMTDGRWLRKGAVRVG